MADPLTDIGAALTPQRSRAAVQWFQNQILRSMGRPVATEPTAPGVAPLRTKPDVVRTVQRVTPASIGSMCSFVYDPKHKRTLPYYDVYPLVFIVHVKPDRFLGINLHYLHPEMRKRLMIDLLRLNKLDSGRRLDMSYAILKRATNDVRFFAPCVKVYLRNFVRSGHVFIPIEEWHMAAALPLQRFVKQPESTVWADSSAAVRS